MTKGLSHILALAASASIFLAACGGAAASPTTAPQPTALPTQAPAATSAPAATKAPAASGDWSKATSAQGAGGMDALVAAAQKEGQLNVITLPPDWCDYADMINNFSKKYNIKVNSLNPNGGSADELQAITDNQGNKGPQAPDVISFAITWATMGLIALFARGDTAQRLTVR